ncbi:hypothetical protein FHQ18_09060 [Deferribacter autotrophicus]|uniref:Uncharacterized protein n=1 Tax=Deferribacter autotrophicus TaxID=500465 RepID=A0A5A8F0U2_9BACT|nr:hypothetical protein [Deferribacter autotrophicus]KAA0257481.1 hypothetical protein FHQ18_09060 [Deferribacter autotrophicus]
MMNKKTFQELKKQNELLKKEIQILKNQPEEFAEEIIDRGVNLYFSYNVLIPLAVVLLMILAPIIFPVMWVSFYFFAGIGALIVLVFIIFYICKPLFLLFKLLRDKI